MTCCWPATRRTPSAFKVLLSHLNHERCGNASMCVGAAQGALEHAVRYMHERVIGGRPLADLQGLQWKLADMAVQLEGARMLLARAVRLAGPHGTPPALETAMAKTAANLAAKFVCDEAMQIHGGYGYSREYPLERAYRDIRGLCFGAGHGGGAAQLHRAAGGRRRAHRVARLEGSARRVLAIGLGLRAKYGGALLVVAHANETGDRPRPLRGQAGLRADLPVRRVRGAADGHRGLHSPRDAGQAPTTAHRRMTAYAVRADQCHECGLCVSGLPRRRHHPGAAGRAPECFGRRWWAGDRCDFRPMTAAQGRLLVRRGDVSRRQSSRRTAWRSGSDSP